MAAAASKSDYRSLVENAPLAPDDAHAHVANARVAAASTRDSAPDSAPNRFGVAATVDTVPFGQRASLRRARREELHFDSHPDTLTPRTKRDQRRAQQHRPIRLTWSTVLCVVIVMAQLVLLLRMNARALEASQQAGALEAKIITTADQIERTQQRISVYDSSAHLAQWAEERGWKQAGHLDIDDVTRAGLAAAMPTPGATTTPDAYVIEGQSKTTDKTTTDAAVTTNDGQVTDDER